MTQQLPHALPGSDSFLFLPRYAPSLSSTTVVALRPQQFFCVAGSSRLVGGRHIEAAGGGDHLWEEAANIAQRPPWSHSTPSRFLIKIFCLQPCSMFVNFWIKYFYLRHNKWSSVIACLWMVRSLFIFIYQYMFAALDLVLVDFCPKLLRCMSMILLFILKWQKKHDG